MLPKYLYHITSASRADTILKQGLLPMKGSNSDMVGESFDKVLFLCDYDDIPYWSVLLGKNVVLEVTTSGLDDSLFKRYDYTLYSEWMIKKPIGINHLSRNPMFINKAEVMPDLCLEYVLNVSDLIVLMTRMGTYPDRYEDRVDIVLREVDSLTTVMNSRLDMSALNEGTIIKKLKEYGDDGDYTMCDQYCVHTRTSGPPLWEQLSMYDFSSPTMSRLKDSYVRLYEFVRDNFKWASKVSTGGYTG